MSQGEFDLIARYFSRLGVKRNDVRIGVGDDGAVFIDSETLRPEKSDHWLARRHSPDHPEIQ